MKLTNANIWTAATALRQACSRHLEIPSLGKYQLARLEKALEKDYQEIEAARIALIQTHGAETFRDEARTVSSGWGVTPGTEGHKAYVAAWDALCSMEREVIVSPVPLASLGESTNGLELGELSALGMLIEE